MKRLLFLLVFIYTILGYSQEESTSRKYTLDVSQFNGSVLLHNPDISHLITGHPSGIIIGYNRKRFGEQQWEADFGYPDTGVSFTYQNMKNSVLGDNYGLYAHFNFYFFKRNLQFRIAQGIAYTTNPYDKNTNFRNNAYGSDFLSSTMLMFNYYKENIVDKLGIKAGISIIHYSNANFRAPNTSTNTMALNVGLVYDLSNQESIQFIEPVPSERIIEAVKVNLALRSGLNESDIINLGQHGFLIVSAYADKRVGRKSAIQIGADVFFSNFLKDLIRYQVTSFPEKNVSIDADYKRVGVFIGHEFFINKMSIITQLGYYVHYPFDFEGKMYNRVGMKRYFGDKIFGSITLKSHGTKAEAVEFGIGVRL